MNPRRASRERALELLYESFAKEWTPQETIAALPLAPDDYTVEMAVGVGAEQSALDERISGHLRKGWTLERLPLVDRIVLRMAIWELLHQRDLSTAVVVSEAVELAKAYGNDESSRFVNGLLASVATDVRG